MNRKTKFLYKVVKQFNCTLNYISCLSIFSWKVQCQGINIIHHNVISKGEIILFSYNKIFKQSDENNTQQKVCVCVCLCVCVCVLIDLGLSHSTTTCICVILGSESPTLSFCINLLKIGTALVTTFPALLWEIYFILKTELLWRYKAYL